MAQPVHLLCYAVVVFITASFTVAAFQGYRLQTHHASSAAVTSNAHVLHRQKHMSGIGNLEPRSRTDLDLRNEEAVEEAGTSTRRFAQEVRKREQVRARSTPSSLKEHTKFAQVKEEDPPPAPKVGRCKLDPGLKAPGFKF